MPPCKEDREMPGKIKAGEGALIGGAGEFYVMAELLKRGVIAGLTPCNARSFDILATRDNRSIRIRVKTKSEKYAHWQWVAKADKSIFRDLHEDSDFTVLVDLTKYTKDMKFYIVATHEIDEILQHDYYKWVNTPGKKGRPHDPENKMRHLDQNKYSDILTPCLNNWDKLWGISKSIEKE